MLRNIGVGVISELIVAAILFVLAVLWLVVGIENPVFYIASILNTKLSIPIYAIIIASIVLIISLFITIRNYFSGTPIESESSSNPYDPFAQEEKLRNLSDTEKAILKFYGNVDGESWSAENLSEVIGENKIRTQIALDSLYEVKLLKVAITRIGGHLYSLSSDGMKAIVNLGYDTPPDL